MQVNDELNALPGPGEPQISPAFMQEGEPLGVGDDVVVAEPVEATAPCEAPELAPEEDEAYTPSQPTYTPNTENEEETEDGEPEVNFNLLSRSDGEPARELNSASTPYQVKKAKPFIDIDDEEEAEPESIPADAEVTSEAKEPETVPNEVQTYEHLDEALAGVVAPEVAATREEAEASDDPDVGASIGDATADAVPSEGKEAIAQNSSTADDSLALSTEEKQKTAKAVELVKTGRKCRYELGEIFDQMHSSLAKRGIGGWQAWCRLIHFPVKTADAHRKTYRALQAVPKDLLTSVLEAGIDPAKPKATKALLQIVDTFYEDGVTKKLLSDLAFVVRQAAKREPSEPTATTSITAPVPVVPLGSVHSSEDGSASTDASGPNLTPESTPNSDTPPPLQPPAPKPAIVTIPLKLSEKENQELEVNEHKLRPYLGTTNLTESVLAAFRRLQQMSLVELAMVTASTSAPKEEVAACV